MRCGNCGSIFENKIICPECGIDIVVFNKLKNISIRFYNKGLKLVNENDLSGAIPILEQCLFYDKNNIKARNLLGLVYCEIGRIAEALKHWIISSSFGGKNNLAITYLDYLQENAREMELFNDCVIMYNRALEYLKKGNDDLAIIQLKKALDTNPNFVDANNLMTLCCIEEKNYQRGEKFIEAVLKIDCRNELALKYKKEIAILNSNKVIKLSHYSHNNNSDNISSLDINKDVKKTDNTRYSYVANNKKIENRKGFSDKWNIVSFFLGAGIIGGLFICFWLPSIVDEKDLEINTLNEALDLYYGETNLTPNDVLELQGKVEYLEAENKVLKSQETKQFHLERLEEAVILMAEKKYESCASIIFEIDTLGFSDSELEKYNTIRATVYPVVSEEFFNQGKGEYFSSFYDLAKISFQNVINYSSNENYIDDAFYYLAKIAEEEEQYTIAREYYNTILEKFPESNQIVNVENSLNQLPLD